MIKTSYNNTILQLMKGRSMVNTALVSRHISVLKVIWFIKFIFHLTMWRFCIQINAEWCDVAFG